MSRLLRLALLAALACASEPEPAAGPASAPEESRAGSNSADSAIGRDSDDRSEWTAGIVDLAAEGTVATLRAVRAARQEGYDRVVFELEGSAPGVHVEYVDRPVRACGSGEPVPLPGDAWLEVRLAPAAAHSEDGRTTVTERRRDLSLPVVLTLATTCDFEAVVTWVLAVRSPERYRVQRLARPTRVVVDVRHPGR